MTESPLHRLLADAERQLGRPVDDSTPLQEVPGLDSLKFMDVISAIEESRGQSLDPDVLGGLETVGDLKQLLA
jgi:acyl carrier protein